MNAVINDANMEATADGPTAAPLFVCPEEAQTIVNTENDVESDLRPISVEGHGMTLEEWQSLRQRNEYDEGLPRVACVNGVSRVTPATALDFTKMINHLARWEDFVLVLGRYPEIPVLPELLSPAPLPFDFRRLGEATTLGCPKFAVNFGHRGRWVHVALVALIDRGDVDLDTVFSVRLGSLTTSVSLGLLLGTYCPSPALDQFVPTLPAQSWSKMLEKWSPYQSQGLLHQIKCHPALWRCAVAQRDEVLLALQNGFAGRSLPNVLAQMCAAYTLELLPTCHVP